MGRRRKYDTARKLEKAVERYFESIRRTATVRDGLGRALVNDRGETMTRAEYVTPPGITSLCLFLGIDKKTWAAYGLDPELGPVVEWTRLTIEAYLETQLLTRTKGITGVIFNLQNNYGWRERVDVRTEEIRQVVFQGEEELTDAADGDQPA